MTQVIEVTSREFRTNQKTYLDYADEGTQIIIKRKKKTSYILIPVQEDDLQLQLSPQLEERIKKGLQEIKEGKTKRYTMDELRQRMDL